MIVYVPRFQYDRAAIYRVQAGASWKSRLSASQRGWRWSRSWDYNFWESQ